MTSRIRYDTTDVDITERFAYWQDAVCDSYVYLGCDSSDKRNFQGSIEMERHSVLSISQVSGKAHRVRRRYRDIRRADDAYFLLSLQTTNTSRISQFEHSSLLNPGDMALYSSTEPYMLELSDNFSQTVVQLPKEKLLARLPNADMLVAQKIDGQSEIAKLVYNNIFAFSEFASTSDAVVGSLVQDTVIDMIATGLAVNTTNTLELSSPEQQVLLRAKLFINENFHKPELDRNLVACKLGASVRQLNRLFEKENTSISRFIRQKRLTTVASELKDERFARLNISQIAGKNGFENFQHFSKCFRSYFGQSPREYRKNS